MKVKPIFFYTLYTVTLFVVFAWVFFPEERAARLLAREISSNDYGVTVQIETVRPVLPPGVAAGGARFSSEGRFNVLCGSVQVFPAIAALFSKEKQAADFRVASCSGRVASAGAGIDFTLAAEGNVRLHRDGRGPWQGRGNIAATGISTVLNHPLLNGIGVSELNFDRADVGFEIKNRQVVLTGCRATGDAGNMTLEGTVGIASPLEKSRLDLTADIQLKGAYISRLKDAGSVSFLLKGSRSGGMAVRITGTLEHPEVRL